MIHDILSIRENSFLEKRNLAINIDPKVASIFMNSNMVAGTLMNLLCLSSYQGKIPSSSPKEIAER